MLGVHVSAQCASVCRLDLLSSVKRASRSRATSRQIANVLVLLIALLAARSSHARIEPTVDELKARVSSANVGDKAKICLEIAEKQLNAADKLYTTDDIEKARSSLTDVVSYSELARDYSIQSRKHQKQTEIAIRAMTRKLNDLAHVLGREEQSTIKDAISHLERVRDDLLAAMFPKGAK
jgi:predicted membrane chloride channel (bestrophin family)